MKGYSIIGFEDTPKPWTLIAAELSWARHVDPQIDNMNALKQ